MQYLFQAWESCASILKAASHILLLSDYDGTLTPIVSRPEEAILSSAVRDKLKALAGRSGFSVGIISGRPISEVKALVGLDGVYYAGNHGLEIEGPALDFIHPIAKIAQLEMKRLARQLSAGLADIQGIIVEDKGLSLSVHYRLVKEKEEKVAADIFRWITSPLTSKGKVRLTSGKKVWEVRPPIDWNKGKAVETIRRGLEAIINGKQMHLIYLGDDTTDEDAFRVVNYPDGYSIFVGRENPSSQASYFLNSPAEVESFLSRLLELK